MKNKQKAWHPATKPLKNLLSVLLAVATNFAKLKFLFHFLTSREKI
jgi:hypothetical protein